MRSRAFAIVLLIWVTACGDDPGGSSSTLADGDSASAARDHCVQSGGEAHVARTWWNTNGDPDTWQQLAGSVELCRFESTEANPEERSRIYVDLVTLYSTEPTLAGTAYLSKVPPWRTDQPSANPANLQCTALGGSSQFGTNVNGGGWTTDDRPTEVVDLCVFPDLSFIDEFGIWYFADGVIRGIDLSTVMRVDATQLPAIFG